MGVRTLVNRINLLVCYQNALGFWYTVPESMTTCNRNHFITAETFAAWIAETYLKKGCRRVICTEYKVGSISKTGLKELIAVESGFVDEYIKKNLGRTWEFTRLQPFFR